MALFHVPCVKSITWLTLLNTIKPSLGVCPRHGKSLVLHNNSAVVTNYILLFAQVCTRALLVSMTQEGLSGRAPGNHPIL